MRKIGVAFALPRIIALFTEESCVGFARVLSDIPTLVFLLHSRLFHLCLLIYRNSASKVSTRSVFPFALRVLVSLVVIVTDIVIIRGLIFSFWVITCLRGSLLYCTRILMELLILSLSPSLQFMQPGKLGSLPRWLHRRKFSIFRSILLEP